MVWKPHLVKGNTLETRAWTHPQTHPCKSGIDFDTNTWKVKSLALGKVAFLLGILNTCFMEEEVIQELHCFILFKKLETNFVLLWGEMKSSNWTFCFFCFDGPFL